MEYWSDGFKEIKRIFGFYHPLLQHSITPSQKHKSNATQKSIISVSSRMS